MKFAILSLLLLLLTHGFWDQELNLGHCSESAKSNYWTAREFPILPILKCTIQQHLVHSKYCAAITIIQFQNTFIIPKESPMIINQHSPFCLPTILITTNLFFISMDFPVLDISYKWNHTIYGLQYMTSFTQYHVFRVLLLYSICQSFVPLYSLILFYCMESCIFFLFFFAISLT